MSLNFYLSIEFDTGGPEPYHHELFSNNITSNLCKMADEAGIYTALWHPDDLSGDGSFPTAGELIPLLENGLKKLKEEPSYYRQFNSPNGWGTYDNFVPFVEKVLNACKQHPKATVETST